MTDDSEAAITFFAPHNDFVPTPAQTNQKNTRGIRMEALVNEYTRLFNHMRDLKEAQCFCTQSELEKIKPYEQVEKYKELGIYNPNEKLPAFAVENAYQLSLQMLETTSQLKILYQLIESEDEETANQLKKNQEAVENAHSRLEEQTRYAMRHSVRER